MIGTLRKSMAKMKNGAVRGEGEKMKAKEKKEKLVKLGKLKWKPVGRQRTESVSLVWHAKISYKYE